MAAEEGSQSQGSKHVKCFRRRQYTRNPGILSGSLFQEQIYRIRAKAMPLDNQTLASRGCHLGGMTTTTQSPYIWSH